MVCALVPQAGRPNSLISLFPVHPAQGDLSHPQGDTESLGHCRFQGDPAGIAIRTAWLCRAGEEGMETCLPRPRGERSIPRSFGFQPDQGQRRARYMGTERIRSFLRADCSDAQCQVLVYNIRGPRPKATQPPSLTTLGWSSPIVLGSSAFSQQLFISTYYMPDSPCSRPRRYSSEQSKHNPFLLEHTLKQKGELRLDRGSHTWLCQL